MLNCTLINTKFTNQINTLYVKSFNPKPVLSTFMGSSS